MKKLILGLVALISLATSVQVSAAVYTVDARANTVTPSSPLGVSVAPFSVGDMFTITVNPLDLWRTRGTRGWSNANGLNGPDLLSTGAVDFNGDNPNVRAGRVIGRDVADLTLGGLTAPFGSLVGEWSNNLGQYFFIGTNYSGLAQASGLKLFVFDNNRSGNSGSILVNVNVAAVPEPETYAMMLAGLGLVGFAARRR